MLFRSLAEALATIPPGRRMYVEIKCGPEVLPELERVLRAADCAPEQLVIIGFNDETMRQVRRRLPHLETLWLCSYKEDKRTKRFPVIGELIGKAKAAGFAGLDLNAKFPLTPAVVAEIKEAGLKLAVWTVNDADAARSLAAVGVDSITTDRPGWLREQMASQ